MQNIFSLAGRVVSAKADFFRYLIVYREGGVYLDIKSTVTRPLSELLQEGDSYLLSYWNNLPGEEHEGFGHYPGLPNYIERGEIIQWYLAAAAGHPLLRKVIATLLQRIDSYNPYVDGVGWTGTLLTTGPIMYTRTVYNALLLEPDKYPVRWLDIIGTGGFKYSVFDSQRQETSVQPPHTVALATNYRKASAPLIQHKYKVLNSINRLYLKILSYRHS